MNHFYKCRKSTLVSGRVHLKIIGLPLKIAIACLLTLTGSFQAYAQQAALLQQKISIQTGSITISKALVDLGRKANCSFSYSDDLIQSDKLVTLNYINTPLKTILKKLLGVNPEMLKVQGNIIHIRIEKSNPIRTSPTGKSDTVKVHKTYDLNQVVVTGQYKPQALNKSIYRVEIIDKAQIRNMAVSNVAELLKQQLNIEIENQSGMGRSKIRVLGLNSQYTKILMDNIPIAGDENMGSDVDLTTISLDDVERVEIIKGAMGVEYGANSIAGVINIITKKSSEHNTDISFEIQEETVRKEYNWRADDHAKGRHIQRISISHNLKDNLSIGGSVSRDQFNGYWGEYEGAGITREISKNRGYDWSPKTSWNTNTFLSYRGKNISAFYKFSYFNSNLTNYGHNANGFLLKDEQIYVNAGVNNDYHTQRYNHHLNLRGDFWKNAYYSFDASYQKNGLEQRRQAINLYDNSVIDKSNGIPGSPKLQATDWQKFYQSQGFYAKGNLLKPIFEKELDFNIGFEMDNTKGNQGYTNFFNDTSLNNPIENTLFTGSGYASFEWNVSPKIMIRPGFRVNYSNKLKLRTNQSVTTRYKVNEHNDLRLIIGTSTRFPNYEELYSWFVNSIHDYRGNPDLRSEYGKSVELQWSFRKELWGNVGLETNLSSMFQHINDRIVTTAYRVEGENTLTGRNTYTNENKYNGLLNQLDVNLVSDKFHFSLGGSLHGYRGSDDASAGAYEKFLLNFQSNAQATYVLPLAIRTSLFFRHVGKQPLYEIVSKGAGADLKATEFIKILNETSAYQNMDFSVAKTFMKNKIDFRVGVKNLFDVTDVKYTAINKPENVYYTLRTLRLYYGRSYFLRLSYKI